MKKSSLSKILIFIIIGVLASVSNVYARTLTISELTTGFNDSDIAKSFGWTSTSDHVSKTFTILKVGENEEAETLLTLHYTDDYIEYENPVTTITQDDAEHNIYTNYIINGIVEGTLNLIDFKNYAIKADCNIETNYDNYGLSLTKEAYNFSGNNQDGSTWRKTGDLVKTFKMSLDTDKLGAMMLENKVDKGADLKVILSLAYPSEISSIEKAPSIKTKDIAGNSVTLTIKAEDSNDTYCEIYRATSENGTYEKITSEPINCENSYDYVDKDLESNTTYYYKIKSVNSSTYSEPLKVTTKSETVKKCTEEGETYYDKNGNIVSKEAYFESCGLVENPKTGIFIPIVLSIVLLLSGIGVLIITKKKSLLKRV